MTINDLYLLSLPVIAACAVALTGLVVLNWANYEKRAKAKKRLSPDPGQRADLVMVVSRIREALREIERLPEDTTPETPKSKRPLSANPG